MVSQISNNRRLRCAGHRLLKRFCFNAVICESSSWYDMVKTRVIRLRSVYSIHFSGSQTKCRTCAIATWRLVLWAPLVARNNHTQSAPEGSETTFICYRQSDSKKATFASLYSLTKNVEKINIKPLPLRWACLMSTSASCFQYWCK